MSDNERTENEELLKLLILIKGFLEKYQDGDTPVRYAYVNKYIEKYSAPNPNKVKINQSVLRDLHDPKSEFTDPKNSVRGYMNTNFKPFLRKVFETVGENWPYEFSIADRNYNVLLLKRRGSGGISYTERIYLRVKYRPFIFNTIASMLTGVLSLIIVLSVFICFAGSDHNNPQTLWTILLFLTIAIISMPMVCALSRLSHNKFVPFHLNEYFVKLSGRDVVLASYASDCPICKNERGIVKVVFSWMRGKGYLGKCQENPDGHVFSFDHTNLTGEKL